MTVDEERVNAERRFSWLPSVRIDQSHFPGTQVQLPWHVGDADDNLRKTIVEAMVRIMIKMMMPMMKMTTRMRMTMRMQDEDEDVPSRDKDEEE